MGTIRNSLIMNFVHWVYMRWKADVKENIGFPKAVQVNSCMQLGLDKRIWYWHPSSHEGRSLPADSGIHSSDPCITYSE